MAWAAGLIDGEGCFNIRRNAPNAKQRTVSPHYVLMLKVTMCDRRTVERLWKMFGKAGSLLHHPAARSNWRDTYSWIVQSRQAEPIIRELLPFLYLKKPQARLALKFLSLPQRPGSVPVDAKVLAKREEFYQAMKEAKNA